MKIYYDDYINRVKPCKLKLKSSDEEKTFTCEHCKSSFSRDDNLKRHIQTVHSDVIQNDNTGDIINNVNGKQRDITIKNTNNKNTNTNNKNINNIQNAFFIVPFGKDGIDCLTLDEQKEILTGNINPFEKILLTVNLNKDKPVHHNVGFPSLKDGHGIIYDGEEWLYERIAVILLEILDSKEKDLMQIYENIKDQLTDEQVEIAMSRLKDCSRIKMDEHNRKLLVSHLKKHLYNKRKYALAAKKEHDKLNKNTDKQPRDSSKTAFQLEFAEDTLNLLLKHHFLNKPEKDFIMEKIKNTKNPTIIKKILDITIKRAFVKDPINHETLFEDLKQSLIIDDFIEENHLFPEFGGRSVDDAETDIIDI